MKEGKMKRVGILILALGIFVFAQTARGFDWGSNQRLSWTAAKRITWTSYDSLYPSIALDSSGNPHVVWQDIVPWNEEIFYRSSPDGGTTWAAKKRLTWNLGSSIGAAVAVDSFDDLHVLWRDNTPGNYELHYRKSTDGGSTWTSARRLTWTSGDSWPPSIVVDSSDNLHVVWCDNTSGDFEIYYKKSADGGTTWSMNKRLTWNSGNSYAPDISIDASGHLHVAWCDNTPGNYEIYYKKSTDGGDTWLSNRRLTWMSGDTLCLDIAADSSSNLHLVWPDTTAGADEIYYKRSQDGGDTWSASQRLTWNSGGSSGSYCTYPAIVDDSFGQLHLVWCFGTYGDSDLYYKKSTDAGATWSFSERVTFSPGASTFPGLVADPSGNLHLVWMDDADGNDEIYYQKGTPGT
jgi:hypothetical protein